MSKDSQCSEHPHIPVLVEELKTGVDLAPPLLRTATLLGLSAVAAYTLPALLQSVHRQQKRSTPCLRPSATGMRCMEIKSPHQADFAERSSNT